MVNDAAWIKGYSSEVVPANIGLKSARPPLRRAADVKYMQSQEVNSKYFKDLKARHSSKTKNLLKSSAGSRNSLKESFD